MKKVTDRILELVGEQKPAKFAKNCGIPQQTFDNYIHGRTPNADNIVKICSTNGVSADWLLGLSDSRNPGTSVTASGGSAAASHNSTATVTGGTTSAELSRLLGIIESQQRVIESLAGGKGQA
jgi:hypothetical protein